MDGDVWFSTSPVVSSLTIFVQGIWEPNVEYADGDYVD